MSYLKPTYLGLDQCCEEFVSGIRLLEQCLVTDSLFYFRQALDSVNESHSLYSKYQSYHGLVHLLCGEAEAVVECRKAAFVDPFDGDICMNLVRAEQFLNNRANAIRSVEMGLKFSPGHTGLLLLRDKMGVRRRNPLPVLARDHPFNQFIGRRLLRKRSGG